MHPQDDKSHDCGPGKDSYPVHLRLCLFDPSTLLGSQKLLSPRHPMHPWDYAVHYERPSRALSRSHIACVACILLPGLTPFKIWWSFCSRSVTSFVLALVITII